MSKIPVRREKDDSWDDFFDRPLRRLPRDPFDFDDEYDDEDFFLMKNRSPFFRSHWRRMHNDTFKDIAYSKVYDGRDKFEIKVDVRHFTPDEINVKTIGRHVIIEGQHGEKEDKHGYVTRQFSRRFSLPDDSKVESATCELTTDGILILTMTKAVTSEPGNEFLIPITQSDRNYMSRKQEKKCSSSSSTSYHHATSSTSTGYNNDLEDGIQTITINGQSEKSVPGEIRSRKSSGETGFNK